MALRAQVPVVYGYLDYPSKTIKVGNAFIPTGDARQDMVKIRDYFKDVRGKFPEYDDVIRLREEDKNEGLVNT